MTLSLAFAKRTESKRAIASSERSEREEHVKPMIAILDLIHLCLHRIQQLTSEDR